MALPAQRLAIEGGPPALPHPLILRHTWGNQARQLLDDLLADGRVSRFYGGPLSRDFERRFSATQRTSHGVSTNSGTSALHVCYRLCGLGPGDEIILPAHAYVTALSVALDLDAIPVLCDVEADTYCMDPDALESCITPRTKVVVPVHLYGRPAAMPDIMRCAKEHSLLVVEDCGQGHGATVDGTPAGGFGAMSAWSFYEIKHVCTGEGGMCLFNDADKANRARSLVHKGKGEGWWDYLEPGFSYPLTDLQAALGLASLQQYAVQVQHRRSIESIYQRVLATVSSLQVPHVPEERQSGAFKTPVRLVHRHRERIDWFVAACAAENLPVQRGYPALHEIEWIRERRHRAWSLLENASLRQSYLASEAPTATDLHERTFAIGTGPGITTADAERIAEGIVKVAVLGFES